MRRRKTLKQAVLQAVEREQRRLASDLHDGICQELAGIAMMLDVILPRVVTDVSAEISSVCALALLKLDVETRSGPTVVVSVDEPFARELTLDIAVNLYRIAQEATTNVVRHSAASHIHISLEVYGEQLLLAIQDDGCGIRDIGSESWGLGMRSMASRAQWLGGELRLMPGALQGTRVQVIVPMEHRKTSEFVTYAGKGKKVWSLFAPTGFRR